MSDLMAAMQQLNKELNGEVPSAAVGDGTSDVIPTNVAYAISEIARHLRGAAHAVEAWEVETAWNAILAGDIDDIAEHVELECHANPPSSNTPAP